MTTVIVIIVVLVVAALAAGAFVMYEKQRRAQLQQRFGSEYDRAVEGADSRREAESHLAGIAQQRDKLDVRDLDEAEQARYSSEWDVVQARFVDEPAQAVDAADGLITTVMRVRGYPVEDFDQRADLVAADHPEVVSHYREAHAAHQRHRDAGGLDTEDLRQSFVHYRALFAALVVDDGDRAEVVDPVDVNRAENVDRVDVDRADDVNRVDVDRAEANGAGGVVTESGEANPADANRAVSDPTVADHTHSQETR